MTSNNVDLDTPIWGAARIGRAAGVVDDNGQVKLRQTFYQLELGRIPAKKVGNQWVSTPRQIRAAFGGESNCA
jgi:hypothetical protein